MARILVLGGSYLQSEFVNTALFFGHAVHILDMNPCCYLAKRKDISFYNINISDVDQVEKHFIENKMDMVISPVTEIGNIVSSIVSERLGLRYNSVSTVNLTTNKILMRQALVKADLNEPRSAFIKDPSLKPDDFKYPLIVKPSVSSASRGVTLVTAECEFKSAFYRAREYSKEGENILIEEFIPGEQYSIEVISYEGVHYVVAIVKEVLSDAPYYMERMDVISVDTNKKLLHQAQDFIQRLLDELGVKYGPSHIEVKVDDGEIRLIEVASRSGLLRDRLIRYANGSDYNKLILDSYLGRISSKAEIRPPSTNALLGIISYPDDLNTFNELLAKSRITDYYFNGKELVDQPKMLTDAIGYFFTQSDDLNRIEEIKLSLI